MQQHPSDVARLLGLINDEYDAAQRGLSGTASGASQHQFITAKMERMEQIHQKLRTHVGEQAMELIVQTLEASQREMTNHSGNQEV